MIARIDGVLGRVTMYRLLTLGLSAIVLVAVVLSALGGVGVLPAGSLASGLLPVAILVSTAVLVAWSILANRLFALLFRVDGHTESAVVTGLILALLLSPTLDPLYLSVDALAATLAMASKYLIAPHGRHLLNPAAFGAFAVYALGLQSTPWWIGTPLLLPVVAIVGAAIVVRTRRGALVGVFLAAALLARIAASLVAGVGIVDGMQLALLYSPVLFLGTVMLTEPLTLPPRRWQQAVVAVVVGVLLAVSLPELVGPALGPIRPQLGATPEIALLVGNLVAFALAGRRGIRLAYRARRRLTPTSWEFEFEPSRPLAFRPGQYLELSLPHAHADVRGMRRTFSIASPPGSPVRLGMRMPPAERTSSFKTALAELEPGRVVAATTVAGDFTLPRDRAMPVLLVAGGIGITPFVAQLGSAEAAERDTVVVYAVSSTDELAYAAELHRSGARVLVVAPEPLPRMPEHWRWIGAGPLTADRLLAEVPDAPTRTTYLSGPPSLIAALRPALRRAGVRRIRTDAFLGY